MTTTSLSETAVLEILGDLGKSAHWGGTGALLAVLSENRMLSHGEQALVRIALAVWNGDSGARLVDIVSLDRPGRQRVLRVLTELWGY